MQDKFSTVLYEDYIPKEYYPAVYRRRLTACSTKTATGAIHVITRKRFGLKKRYCVSRILGTQHQAIWSQRGRIGKKEGIRSRSRHGKEALQNIQSGRSAPVLSAASAVKQVFGGAERVKAAIRAGKQAFAGTDAPKPRVRTGKRAFAGTEVGKVAVRAGKTAFGGTEDAQTVGGAVEQ